MTVENDRLKGEERFMGQSATMGMVQFLHPQDIRTVRVSASFLQAALDIARALEWEDIYIGVDWTDKKKDEGILGLFQRDADAYGIALACKKKDDPYE